MTAPKTPEIFLDEEPYTHTHFIYIYIYIYTYIYIYIYIYINYIYIYTEREREKNVQSVICFAKALCVPYSFKGTRRFRSRKHTFLRRTLQSNSLLKCPAPRTKKPALPVRAQCARTPSAVKVFPSIWSTLPQGQRGQDTCLRAQ